MSIVARLETIRESLKKSGKEFAHILEIKEQTYSSIKKNNRKISINEIKILKEKLNISSNWLIFGEGEMYLTSEINLNNLIDLINDSKIIYNIDINIDRILIEKISDKIIYKIYKDYKFYDDNGDRFNFLLYNILIEINFYIGRKETAKEDFINIIKKFDDGSPFLKKIKDNILNIVEKLNNEDCFYILKYKQFFLKKIYNKISENNRKIIENKSTLLKPIYAPIKYFFNLPVKKHSE